MDVPVIARIGEFKTSLTSLNLISALPSGRLWKWGALLVTLVYALRILGRVIRVFISQLHERGAKLISSTESLVACDFEFVSSDDEDSDGVESSCSSEDERDPASSSCEDFRAKGSSNSGDRVGRERKFRIRRRRSFIGNSWSSLADLVSGEGVVKFWDGMGLIPAAAASSPSVFFLGSGDGEGRVGLRLWDVRLRRRMMPAVEADWPATEDDAGGGMKVWDLRNAKTALTGYNGGH